MTVQRGDFRRSARKAMSAFSTNINRIASPCVQNLPRSQSRCTCNRPSLRKCATWLDPAGEAGFN